MYLPDKSLLTVQTALGLPGSSDTAISDTLEAQRQHRNNHERTKIRHSSRLSCVDIFEATNNCTTQLALELISA